MNPFDFICLAALALVHFLAVVGPFAVFVLLRERSARRRSACHVRVPRIGIELPSARWMVSSAAPRDVRRAL